MFEVYLLDPAARHKAPIVLPFAATVAQTSPDYRASPPAPILTIFLPPPVEQPNAPELLSDGRQRTQHEQLLRQRRHGGQIRPGGGGERGRVAAAPARTPPPRDALEHRPELSAKPPTGG